MFSINGSAASELAVKGFTRRQVTRIATLLTAGASLPFYNEAALAQNAEERATRGPISPDAVRIGSNENPFGPMSRGSRRNHQSGEIRGRYQPHGETAEFVRTAAESEGVKPKYIAPFAGSSDPLHRATCAFVSPTKGFVMGDPGYEAGARTASFIGANVLRIPLRKDYSHDVEALCKADPNAGVIYICNPNNPTGTLTSRQDIEYVLENKPKGSILLLDEAYVHFCTETPASDLVAKDKELIILRTFSKAYGMAGIRAGMAIGRPDLLEKIRPYGSGMLPITGLAAATASLKVKTLIPERRHINRKIRDSTLAFLDKKGFAFVPSQSNKFMLEVKRPGMEIVKALAQEKVMIGRVWPAWPTHVRVSVGTQDDMDKFKAALL